MEDLVQLDNYCYLPAIKVMLSDTSIINSLHFHRSLVVTKGLFSDPLLLVIYGSQVSLFYK